MFTMNINETNAKKIKANLLWKTLDMKFNKASGYVSYKNLNSQLGSIETTFDEKAEGIRKIKDLSDWKKSYSGFSAVQKRGFCISKVTDSIIMEKIDELHQIISSKPFYNRVDKATSVFNTIVYDNSEELREYNKPPYDRNELKIDGGRNMLMVSKLKESNPMEKKGKQLSEEIGEHLRVKILKGLKASTFVKRKDGMVLTWLETQGQVEGHKVVLKCLSFI